MRNFVVQTSPLVSAMSNSFRDYFHLKNDFPDLLGSLSSQAIVLANKEVKKVLREKGSSIKHVVPSSTTALFGSPYSVVCFRAE